MGSPFIAVGIKVDMSKSWTVGDILDASTQSQLHEQQREQKNIDDKVQKLLRGWLKADTSPLCVCVIWWQSRSENIYDFTTRLLPNNWLVQIHV